MHIKIDLTQQRDRAPKGEEGSKKEEQTSHHVNKYWGNQITQKTKLCYISDYT